MSSRFITELKRTHSCGALRGSDVGREAVLMGWVHSRRDHGGCIFVDLPDRDGVTQVVFRPEVDADSHTRAHDVRNEFVIAIRGKAVSPRQNVNKKISPGEIALNAVKVTHPNR